MGEDQFERLASLLICAGLAACSCGRSGYDGQPDASGPDAGALFAGFSPLALPAAGHVTDLALSEARSGRAYAVVAGGRVFRSENLGSSWIECAAVDGAKSVYALPSAADTVYVGTGSDIRRSDDACASWTVLAQPDGGYAFLEAADGSLIVATGAGLRRLGASGWEDIPGPLDGVAAVRIVADAARQNLYATTSGNSDSILAYSTDGGVSWESTINSRPLVLIRDIAIDHAVPSRVYVARSDGCHVYDRDLDSWTQHDQWQCFSVATTAADPQRVLFVRDDFVRYSGNGGASYDVRYTQPLGIGRLRYPPGSTDRVVGGGRYGWATASGNYGTWSLQNSGLAAQHVVDLAARDDSDVIAVTGPTLLAISAGSGWTWAPPIHGHKTYTRVVPDRSSGRFYFTGGQLLRTDDAGQTTATVYDAGGADDYRISAVFADGPLIVMGSSRRLIVSQDGAQSWTPYTVGLGEPDVVDIVEGGDAALWLATDAGVFRTDDLGATSTAVNDGLVSLDVRRLAPTSDGALLAATSDGLYRLDAGSSRWVPVPGVERVAIHDVVVRGQRMAAVASSSVFASIDGGVEWIPLSGFDGAGRSVEIEREGAIVVGTAGWGVYRAAPIAP